VRNRLNCVSISAERGAHELQPIARALRASAGLLLAIAGLLIAGHTWAAVVVLALTLVRYGYYLYLRYKVRR
jgi:hypothetical protein